MPSPKPVAASPCDHRPTVWPPPRQIFKENFFYKFHQPPEGEAALYELLFRPRKWVREAARCGLRSRGRGAARLTARTRAGPIHAPPLYFCRCVMRSHGLHGSNYIVLHVRVSEEKSRERGKQMPNLDVYPKAAASALLKANVTRVFLQACAHGVCAWRVCMACAWRLRMAFLPAHAWCVYGPDLAADSTIHAHAYAHADGHAERGDTARGLESEGARASLVHEQ